MRIFLAILAVAFAMAAGQAQAITVEMKPPSLVAKVDIASQTMNVFEHGKKIHTWKISSGTRRHPTRRGNYKPYRMHRMWHSRKYDWAEMPYAVFYSGGFAIHGTKAVSRLGRPASHGCVRLKTSNAKKFYNLVRKHKRARTLVSVSGAYDFAKHYKKRKKVAKKRINKRRKLTAAQMAKRSRALAAKRKRQAERRRLKRHRKLLARSKSRNGSQTFIFGIFNN